MLDIDPSVRDLFGSLRFGLLLLLGINVGIKGYMETSDRRWAELGKTGNSINAHIIRGVGIIIRSLNPRQTSANLLRYLVIP